jgi:hypothetical protein
MASRQWGGCRGTYLPCWRSDSSYDAFIHTQSPESVCWMMHNEGGFKLTPQAYAGHVTVVMLFLSAMDPLRGQTETGCNEWRFFCNERS